MVSLASTSTYNSFSDKLVFSSCSLACKGVIPVYVEKTCLFLLMNMMLFLSTHFPSLWSFLWIAVYPSDVSSTHPTLVQFVIMLRVYSVPPSNLLIKLLYCIGSSINTWGRQLVAGFQLDFVLPITALSSLQLSQYSVHLTGHLPWSMLHEFVSENIMEDSAGTLVKVNLNNMYCSPSTHWADHFIAWWSFTDPCCIITLFLSFTRICSAAFLGVESQMIGLPLSGSSFLPFFKIGVTFTLLQ